MDDLGVPPFQETSIHIHIYIHIYVYIYICIYIYITIYTQIQYKKTIGKCAVSNRLFQSDLCVQFPLKNICHRLLMENVQDGPQGGQTVSCTLFQLNESVDHGRKLT